MDVRFGKRAVWTAAIVAAAIVVVIGILIVRGMDGRNVDTASGKWGERAASASVALEQSFWDDKRRMFNNASPCILQLCTDPFNYWWQAHAADVLIDAYLRTQSEEAKVRIGELFEGIRDRNAGMWTNAYYDDMEWMALAWLRAYEALGEDKYKEAALELWTDIQTGWNEEMGGGIAWRKEQLDYKNTPANAPAVILAARLYRIFGDENDLVWAKRIYDWQKSTLVDPESGLVWDGLNRTGDEKIDVDWRFTYGQGVFIGAALELYQLSGEESYLADARKTANYVLDEMSELDWGLLPNEGEGDGGLFKGILIRYLGQLAIQDADKNGAYASLIYMNAERLWMDGQSDERGLFGPSWAEPAGDRVQLSTQLSGNMLLEQAAALERAGIKRNSK